MNTASQNLIEGTRQTEHLSGQLDGLAIGYDHESSQLSSAEQGREECDPGSPHSSRAFSGGCADLVHELANTTTAVLINAQLLGWKLPPYSRLKRPVREIERNAQRGSELIKRLLILATDTGGETSEDELCAHPPSLGLTNTVTAQEPGVASASAVNQPPRTNSCPAPVFSADLEIELTARCDACTSTFPKKG